jgi:hypothetical protein
MAYYQNRFFALKTEELPIQLFSVNEFDKNNYNENKCINTINYAMTKINSSFSQFIEKYQEIKNITELYNNVIKNINELYNNVFDNIIELYKNDNNDPEFIRAFINLWASGIIDRDGNLCLEKWLNQLINNVFETSNGLLLIDVTTETKTLSDQEETIEKLDIKYADAYIKRVRLVDYVEVINNLFDVIYLFYCLEFKFSNILDSFNYILKTVKTYKN